MATWNKGNSAAIDWIRAHLTYVGDDCIQWPFFRAPSGYGRVGIGRVPKVAHRVMCEMIYGPPPTPKHQAAHSCGNGAHGCMNPKHLSWKTQSENSQDKRRHGTAHRAGRKNRFGLKGINHRNGRWTATFTSDGRQKHLGSFSSLGEAIAAYDAKALEARAQGKFYPLNRDLLSQATLKPQQR